jgi:hypothetical protein
MEFGVNILTFFFLFLAGIFLHELQLTIMPALLKVYRLDSLVDLSTYVEQYRFRYFEDFDFLGIPIAESARNFYQYAELFFVLHYTDDGKMTDAR